MYITSASLKRREDVKHIRIDKTASRQQERSTSKTFWPFLYEMTKSGQNSRR